MVVVLVSVVIMEILEVIVSLVRVVMLILIEVIVVSFDDFFLPLLALRIVVVVLFWCYCCG